MKLNNTTITVGALVAFLTMGIVATSVDGSPTPGHPTPARANVSLIDAASARDACVSETEASVGRFTKHPEQRAQILDTIVSATGPNSTALRAFVAVTRDAGYLQARRARGGVAAMHVAEPLIAQQCGSSAIR